MKIRQETQNLILSVDMLLGQRDAALAQGRVNTAEIFQQTLEITAELLRQNLNEDAANLHETLVVE